MRNLPKRRMTCADQPYDRSRYAPRATFLCRNQPSVDTRHRKANDRSRSVAVSHHNRPPKSFQLSFRVDTISK